MPMLSQSLPILDERQPTPPSPSRYPFGVRMIIVLFLLKALLLMVMLITYFASSTLDAEYRAETAALIQSEFTVVTYSLLAIFNIVAAIGLWRRQRWAWVLTMTLLAYSMILDIVSFFGGQPNYVAMLLNVVQVGYLNQTEVQELFGGNNRRTPQ